MSKRIEELVEKASQGLVEELGYELADVEYKKEADGWVLTLYIYRPEGVNIDDCEKVSRAVDPLIDELDPVEEAYILSVSSLGIDRPFKKLRDYERAMGSEIEIHLYAPIDKKKQYVGILKSADKEEVKIDCDGQERVFTQKQIALARPMLRF